MDERHPPSATGDNWRDYIETVEVDDGDAKRFAGPLFRKSFGHPVPPMPRHFVMRYLPPRPDDSTDARPRVIGYVHQMAYENVYLAGGMCIDSRCYRIFPPWLFDQVKGDGGLATIVMRESIAMLGDCPAVFGHVGDKRARLADLRAGFVDTARRHLMVNWRKSLPLDEQERLIERVSALGPF